MITNGYKNAKYKTYQLGDSASFLECLMIYKTSQELRMLSSVTLNCQVTKIVMDSGSQLSEL